MGLAVGPLHPLQQASTFVTSDDTAGSRERWLVVSVQEMTPELANLEDFL